MTFFLSSLCVEIRDAIVVVARTWQVWIMSLRLGYLKRRASSMVNHKLSFFDEGKPTDFSAVEAPPPSTVLLLPIVQAAQEPRFGRPTSVQATFIVEDGRGRCCYCCFPSCSFLFFSTNFSLLLILVVHTLRNRCCTSASSVLVVVVTISNDPRQARHGRMNDTLHDVCSFFRVHLFSMNDIPPHRLARSNDMTKSPPLCRMWRAVCVLCASLALSMKSVWWWRRWGCCRPLCVCVGLHDDLPIIGYQ